MSFEKTNIALSGFMGTGKTTVAKIIAQKTKKLFYDTDAEIEKKFAMEIKEIFEKFGEEKFRQAEFETIKEISLLKEIVISLGGGAVLNLTNIENLKKHSLIVNLKADPQIIYERVKGNSDRPILRSAYPSLEEIQQLLESRQPFYDNCDFAIDVSKLSPQEVAAQILKRIPNHP